MKFNLKKSLLTVALGAAVSATVFTLPTTRLFAEEKSSSKETTSDSKPDAQGFVAIFNGKDLTGWKGLEEYWTVKDGVISGHETKDKSKQTFLVWQGGPVSDFELHLKFKFATNEG